MEYSELKDLYVGGVIAYVKDKNCYITASRNLLQTITRLMPDYKNWEMVILETNTEIELLKVQQKYWITVYKLSGYTILNKRPPVNYSIKVKINKDFKVEVWLYTSHHVRTLLNTFDYMEDAKRYALEQSKKYHCTETCT
jgi:hypothetical protein